MVESNSHELGQSARLFRMSASADIRLATDADLELLVVFRMQMFRDMGWTDEQRLAELAPAYRDYVRDAVRAGDFVAWVAESDGEPAGGVAVLWERVPPTVRNLSGRQAYILAAYVAPPFRREGLGCRLIETAIVYAREHGADVVSLHYSPAGKGLYEKFGFVESPEMRLFTDPMSAAWSPQAPGHTPADDAD
jgi:ribosomal protein S18 acetylase RimI-like enzyme